METTFFVQYVAAVDNQELGLLLVLVAVAILTYSSLVYFAEREGQVLIIRMIKTVTVTVTSVMMEQGHDDDDGGAYC